MNCFRKTIVSTVTLLLSAGLAAQGGQINRTFDFVPQAFRGDFGIAGHVYYSDVNTSPLVRVQTTDLGLYEWSRVRMFGRSREAYFLGADHDSSLRTAFDLSTRSTRRTFAASNALYVRVNGITVFNYTSTDNAVRRFDLLPLPLFGTSGFTESLSIAGFNVSLRANATSDVNATFTPRFSLTVPVVGLKIGRASFRERV